ncbi:MAG: hypothetical protein MJY79_08665 [Bacteroidaceae bacterium]|nr:hypothetical protein [Bacteroidaceae bacterium]
MKGFRKVAMIMVLVAQMLILCHAAIPHHHHSDDPIPVETTQDNDADCHHHESCISIFTQTHQLQHDDYCPVSFDLILPEEVFVEHIHEEYADAFWSVPLPAGVPSGERGFRAPPVI